MNNYRIDLRTTADHDFPTARRHIQADNDYDAMRQAVEILGVTGDGRADVHRDTHWLGDITLNKAVVSR